MRLAMRLEHVSPPDVRGGIGGVTLGKDASAWWTSQPIMAAVTRPSPEDLAPAVEQLVLVSMKLAVFDRALVVASLRVASLQAKLMA
jgi:hypothetical protein